MTNNQSGNQRRFFRIDVQIGAKIRKKDEPIFVTISNISISGMMIISEQPLEIDAVVPIQFTLQDNTLVLQCKILRLLREENEKSVYGVEFKYLSSSDSKIITSFIFNEHKKARQRTVMGGQ